MLLDCYVLDEYTVRFSSYSCVPVNTDGMFRVNAADGVILFRFLANRFTIGNRITTDFESLIFVIIRQGKTLHPCQAL